MAGINDETRLLEWYESLPPYLNRDHRTRSHAEDLVQGVMLRLLEGRSRGAGIPNCPPSEAEYRWIVEPIVRTLRPRHVPREDVAKSAVHRRQDDGPPEEDELTGRLKAVWGGHQYDALLGLFSDAQEKVTHGKIAEVLGVSPRTLSRWKQSLRAESGATPRDYPPR